MCNKLASARAEVAARGGLTARAAASTCRKLRSANGHLSTWHVARATCHKQQRHLGVHEAPCTRRWLQSNA